MMVRVGVVERRQHRLRGIDRIADRRCAGIDRIPVRPGNGRDEGRLGGGVDDRQREDRFDIGAELDDADGDRAVGGDQRRIEHRCIGADLQRIIGSRDAARGVDREHQFDGNWRRFGFCRKGRDADRGGHAGK